MAVQQVAAGQAGQLLGGDAGEGAGDGVRGDEVVVVGDGQAAAGDQQEARGPGREGLQQREQRFVGRGGRALECLARPTNGLLEALRTSLPEEDGLPGALETPMTRTGALAYMAIEQLAGNATVLFCRSNTFTNPHVFQGRTRGWLATGPTRRLQRRGFAHTAGAGVPLRTRIPCETRCPQVLVSRVGASSRSPAFCAPASSSREPPPLLPRHSPALAVLRRRQLLAAPHLMNRRAPPAQLRPRHSTTPARAAARLRVRIRPPAGPYVVMACSI